LKSQYITPVELNRVGIVDWDALSVEVRKDVEIAGVLLDNIQLTVDSPQPTATPAPTVEPGEPISVYYDIEDKHVFAIPAEGVVFLKFHQMQ